MLIKCKECGKEIENNEKKCPNCGYPIKSIRNTKIIIVIFVLVLLLISILIINIQSKTRKNDNIGNIYGNETFNLTSYTDNFIQYNDWIIFSNGVSTVLNKTVSNYKEGVYKYNLKTGQVIQLTSRDGYSFNIIGNRLYYINKYNGICYVNLDTLESNEITRIDNSNYKATDMFICDNYIYYREQNGQNIYRTNFSGSSKNLIAEYTTGNFQIYDNFIYYIDAKSFTLIKKEIINNSEPIQLTDEKISNFNYKDNKIVYIVGSELKMLNIDDNSTTILKQGITSNFVINDKDIYTYAADIKSIIKVNIEDKTEEIIVDNIEKDINRLQLYNGILYYSNRQSNGLWSSYVTTTLYKFNINTKIQEKLQFKV